MCLAIPSKIIGIKGKWATIEANGHNHRANLSLIKNAKIGDYVIIHGELALNKISAKEAKEILKITKSIC